MISSKRCERIRVATRRTEVEIEVTEPGDRTPMQRIRIPVRMWDAYDRVVRKLGTDRSADVLEHVRQRIREYGDEQDLVDLEAAEAELAERRARRGGRPRRKT